MCLTTDYDEWLSLFFLSLIWEVKGTQAFNLSFSVYQAPFHFHVSHKDIILLSFSSES